MLDILDILMDRYLRRQLNRYYYMQLQEFLFCSRTFNLLIDLLFCLLTEFIENEVINC